MVYQARIYFRIVFKTPNMSQVSLTQNISEGPKTEDSSVQWLNNIQKKTRNSANLCPSSSFTQKCHAHKHKQ